MASGFIGNEVPGNRLRVRVPCPPLPSPVETRGFFYAPEPEKGTGVNSRIDPRPLFFPARLPDGLICRMSEFRSIRQALTTKQSGCGVGEEEGSNFEPFGAKNRHKPFFSSKIWG
jgi:hypothetical protein